MVLPSGGARRHSGERCALRRENELGELAHRAGATLARSDVMRVLARIYAIASDIKQSATRREVQRLADALENRLGLCITAFDLSMQP